MHKYFFFEKNEDGTYTYFGKKVEKKPFWSFGLRSLIGSILNIGVLLWGLFGAADFLSDGRLTAFFIGLCALVGIYLVKSDIDYYKEL